MKQKKPSGQGATMQSGTGPQKIDTDPLGSYTGVPDDPYEEPVQDVDDL